MSEAAGKIKRKLNSKAGFSLTEMLATVIIMLLVSAIVASGIPAAREAYEGVVLASNAEVLLSSTITVLRNEIGTAKEVKQDPADSSAVIYYNMTRGSFSRIYKDGEGIWLVRYYSPGTGEAANQTTAPELLISKKTATADMFVTYGSLTVSNDGYVTFSNLSVDRESGRTGLAVRENVSIGYLVD